MARGSVQHRPDAVRIDPGRFPLIVFLRGGRGYCTEDTQVPVRDIADAVEAGGDVAAVASRHGTTDEHVRQAVAFAAEHLAHRD